MLDFLIGNSFLSSVIAFIIVLIPAVIIHELGHLFAAKAVGITVLEFGIGFPPRIARLFRWGETEFTLNWIQLGGFVRPLGEDMIRPLSEEETERDRQQAVAAAGSRQERREENYLSERDELAARGVINTKSVNEANPYQRILFMAAGALANFVSAFLIFVLIGLIGLPTEVGGRIQLTDIPEASAFAEAGLEDGDYIERIDGAYFLDSRDFFRQLQARANQEVTLSVLRPVENAANELFEVVVMPTTEEIAAFVDASGYVLVESVVAGSPAEEAGLVAGDYITGVNGAPFAITTDPVSQLQQLSQEYAGQEITLSLLRGDETLETTLVPRVEPPPDSGRIGIGISAAFTDAEQTFFYGEGGTQFMMVPQSLGGAVNFAFTSTTDVLRMIAEFPARVIQGVARPEETRIVSVVGVSQIGGRILQDSIEQDQPIIILEYIALISIALGITNLLPIPALDGGRILFVLIEIVRGRPIAPEREGVVHLAGLIFLLSIGVIFIINDLVNPLTNLLP
jgi:regulator of sigma E protease